MPSRRKRLAEAMSRKDWASIAHSRQVARDDVEDPHKSTWQDEPFAASVDRVSCGYSDLAGGILERGPKMRLGARREAGLLPES